LENGLVTGTTCPVAGLNRRSVADVVVDEPEYIKTLPV
jgi:hypothetical protein